MAFFSFRKSYKVEYGMGCIFISFYIQYALTLKLIYGVLVQIVYVKNYMDKNYETNIYVKWASILFGQHLKSQSEDIVMFNRNQNIYLFCLFITIYSCQVWR